MTLVWFCLACDDQPPWTADILRPCPACGTTDSVQKAKRFGNLETDDEGKPHETDRIDRP